MAVLEAVDQSAPYRAAIDDPGVPDEPDTWGIWTADGEQYLGGLNEDEARRIAAALTYCRRLTTEQIEAKVKAGRIPVR